MLRFIPHIIMNLMVSVSCLSDVPKPMVPDDFRKLSIAKLKPEWLKSEELAIYMASAEHNGEVEIFVAAVATGRAFFDVRIEIKQNGNVLIPFQVLFKRILPNTLRICSVGKIRSTTSEVGDLEISQLTLIAK